MKCTKCGAELIGNPISCIHCGAFLGYSNNYNMESVNVATKNNGRGTGALILGILALIFDVLSCLIFPFGLVSFVLGIIGLILGSKNKGHTKADTGKILSIIALSLVVVCMGIGLLLFIGGGAYIEYESRPWYEKL